MLHDWLARSLGGRHAKVPVVDLLGAVLQAAAVYKMTENSPSAWAISYNFTNNTSFTFDDLRWVTTAGQMHVLLQGRQSEMRMLLHLCLSRWSCMACRAEIALSCRMPRLVCQLGGSCAQLALHVPQGR